MVIVQHLFRECFAIMLLRPDHYTVAIVSAVYGLLGTLNHCGYNLGDVGMAKHFVHHLPRFGFVFVVLWDDFYSILSISNNFLTNHFDKLKYSENEKSGNINLPLASTRLPLRC